MLGGWRGEGFVGSGWAGCGVEEVMTAIHPTYALSGEVSGVLPLLTAFLPMLEK